MSTSRQAVTLPPRRTGFGNFPSRTHNQIVLAEAGMSSITLGRRINPTKHALSCLDTSDILLFFLAASGMASHLHIAYGTKYGMDAPPPRGVIRELILLVGKYSSVYGVLKILKRMKIFLDRGFLMQIELRKKFSYFLFDCAVLKINFWVLF